jgi:hypothetical protein
MHLRTESALERVFDLLQDAPDIPVINIRFLFGNFIYLFRV